MKKIKLHRIELEYDKNKILSEIDKLSFDYYHNYSIANDIPDWICTSKTKFEKLKKEFKNDVIKLLESVETIDLKSFLTKKEVFHRSKKKVLLSSDINVNYSDEYGSHNYEEICLAVTLKDGDPRYGILAVCNVSEQSSF